MTRCRFLWHDGRPAGFELDGHTGFASHGADIVCAAVSSAALMTANTITEICGVPARIEEGDGRLRVELPPDAGGRCRDLLDGFRLHMTQLAAQYPDHLAVDAAAMTDSTEV